MIFAFELSLNPLVSLFAYKWIGLCCKTQLVFDKLNSVDVVVIDG